MSLWLEDFFLFYFLFFFLSSFLKIPSYISIIRATVELWLDDKREALEKKNENVLMNP